MESVQGLPIKTIKKVTAKLTHKMVRVARFALGMPGRSLKVRNSSKDRSSHWLILLTGAAIPGIPVKEFALLLCMELGIMGIITPFADAASPIYANSGYLPAKDYWRLGTIFGAIFLISFLAIAVPWAFFLWGK